MSLLGINKRGKLVVGGIVAFALIATASTGLAAWVIGSQNNVMGGPGNISVSTVRDNSINITISEGEYKVNFGPLAPQVINEGTPEEEEEVYYNVINYDPANPSDVEDLEFSFKISYTLGDSVTNFAGVRVHLFAPNDDDGLSKTIIDAAQDGGYIDYPFGSEVLDELEGIQILPKDYTTASLDSNGLYMDIGFDDPETDDEVEGFANGSYTFKGAFKWGTKTGGMNPCEYFDASGAGRHYDEAKAYLNDLVGLFETVNPDDDTLKVLNEAKYVLVVEPRLA